MQLDLIQENERLCARSPEEIIALIAHRFGGGVAMTSSFGAEAALMLHLAKKVMPDIPVIFINTNYLFAETYQFAVELTDRFKLNLKVYSSPVTPIQMEKEHGKLWEQGEEGMKEYNQIRKVEPLARALKELGVMAVLHGVRADQTETRASLKTIERRSDEVYKIHPLLEWSAEKVAEYMFANDLPYHPLVYKGYGSIGDIHSTVPGKGREGRMLPGKECGIHFNDPGADI